MVAEKTVKNFRGYFILLHPVCCFVLSESVYVWQGWQWWWRRANSASEHGILAGK